MIRCTASGDWSKTFKFLNKANNLKIDAVLDRAGALGVKALQSATPVRSGKTASGWTYETQRGSRRYKIVWKNTNMNRGYCIAVLIQYGHGTGWGGYVQGIDYVNPAMAPVFSEIADLVWKEVTS